MRLIGEIADLAQAEKFVSYLLTQGVKSKAEAEDGQFEIWVKEEDLVERATGLLNEFLANPALPKYQNAVEQAQQILQKDEEKRRQAEKNVVHMAHQKGGSGAKFPLTILLVVISGIVFLATDRGHQKESFAYRAFSYASINNSEIRKLATETDKGVVINNDGPQVELYNIQRGQIWRAITPIFIHFDIFHIVFNMLWMVQLGKVIEQRYGTLFLGVLVVIAAIVSNSAQQLAPHAWGGSGVFQYGQYWLSNFGGMSGVVFALLGFLWLRPIVDPSCNYRVPQTTFIIMMVYMFICMLPLHQMFESLKDFRVANWAHVMGLVAGLAVAYVPMMFRQRK